MVSHPEGGWALEQAPQDSGHSPRSARVQEAFEQCSQTFVTLGVSVQDQELDWMILIDPFQLSIVHDSMTVVAELILFHITFPQDGRH